jgi:hypothetical protein
LGGRSGTAASAPSVSRSSERLHTCRLGGALRAPWPPPHVLFRLWVRSRPLLELREWRFARSERGACSLGDCSECLGR